MTPHTLREQNERFKGTGGISQHNRSEGFLPAFLDMQTGTVYLSRFADGRIAPMHVLDGLPPELVLTRTASGRVSAINNTVTDGFVRGGVFYTRDEAAKIVGSTCSDFHNDG